MRSTSHTHLIVRLLILIFGVGFVTSLLAVQPLIKDLVGSHDQQLQSTQQNLKHHIHAFVTDINKVTAQICSNKDLLSTLEELQKSKSTGQAQQQFNRHLTQLLHANPMITGVKCFNNHHIAVAEVGLPLPSAASQAPILKATKQQRCLGQLQLNSKTHLLFLSAITPPNQPPLGHCLISYQTKKVQTALNLLNKLSPCYQLFVVTDSQLSSATRNPELSTRSLITLQPLPKGLANEIAKLKPSKNSDQSLLYQNSLYCLSPIPDSDLHLILTNTHEPSSGIGKYLRWWLGLSILLASAGLLLAALLSRRLKHEVSQRIQELELENKTKADRLEQYNKQLQSINAELTNSLADLAQQQKLLERSNKDLDQFAYAISHDLKQPLRIIKSYTQLLEHRFKDRLENRDQDLLFYIIDGVNRMHSMIAGLLDFSRIGREHKSIAMLDTNEVLKNALANLKTTIEELDATIEYETLPQIPANAQQLLRVFQNLIDNALKYRSSEAPHIRISSALNQNDCVITIADNGLGIDPEQRQRAFRVFQRLHTYDQIPGDGLGLSLVRRIVDVHGGQIWIEGAPGEGTKVHIRWPLSSPSDSQHLSLSDSSQTPAD